MTFSYAQVFSDAMLPEPELTVSEWADDHRLLDQASSSEPGRWRTSRTPYLEEIMNCLSSSSMDDTIVFMKGAQIGATEAGLNFILYAIHHAPAGMLYVLPTVDSAKRVSKQRVAPAIDAIPEVADKVATPRARDTGNTLFQKDFPGGTLILTGANSAVGLRSMPARYLFLDEVDAYPNDLDGEGSPVQLAIRRTATFKRNRKIFMCSTPTIKGLSTIEDYFEQSDQRRYFVPCPDCGEEQTIQWKNIHWTDDDPTTAHMVCEHCGVVIPETQKTNMLNAGKWRPTAKGRFKGFHLSSLYSPAGWYGWEDAVEDFIAAKKGGSEQLKTFVQTVLAETWEDQGEQADPDVLITRREDYPEDIEFICKTVGVDVQKDRLELELVGWGEGEESWGLEYIILPGDTAQPEVWDDLTDTLSELEPDSVAIDSGYNTQFVYDYVAKRKFCWAVKGVSGSGVPLIEDQLKRAQRLRRRKKRGFSPEPVGVDQGKTLIYSRLGIEQPGAGYCHFPVSPDYDDEYFAQLTAEKLVTRYTKGRPKQEWVQTRSRNEAIDVRVYGLAALRLFGTNKKKPPPPPTEKPVSTLNKMRRRFNTQDNNAWL